jgi:type II secretory pathway pseudopilin PulG
MLNRRSRVRGIGLLEIMLSLAIIALIIIMATRYFSVAQQQQKITQTMNMVTTLLQVARTYGAGVSSFPCDYMTSTLENAELISKGYGTTRPGPWGTVQLKGRASPNSELCGNIQVEIVGVPKEAFTIISENIMNNQGPGPGLVESVCGSGGVGC